MGRHGTSAQNIERLVETLAEAWRRGDAAAFAARFADDGSFTNVLGSLFYGREAFETRHALLFNGPFKGSKCQLSIGRLKFLRDDVAVADVDSAVTGAKPLPGIAVAADGVTRTKLQLVLVKDGEEWWIAAFHNVAVTPPPPGSP